jgi:hypothetical protein
MSELRVELFFDQEANNWHYRVPALHINGGGTPTREEAERDCLSAITFALEGDPRDYDADAETVTFDVRVAPAAWPAKLGFRHVLGHGQSGNLAGQEAASLLARRPYDLRRAAVSTWLNAGVPAPQVADWAGHSVDVLLPVYAKCISGQQHEAKRRIEEATRPRDDE